jgi:hypothetical protein
MHPLVTPSRVPLVGLLMGAAAVGLGPCFVTGMPMGAGLLAFVALAVSYVGPGLCLAELCLRDGFRPWQRAVAGVVAGPLVALPFVYLAGLLGMPTARLQLVELALALPGAWGWWRMLRALAAEPPRLSQRGALGLLALWAGVVLVYVVPCVTDLVFEPDGELRVHYLDSTWTWAQVSLSRHEVPPPTPVFPTRPLSYHSFNALLAARLSVLSGLEGVDALQRVVRPMLVGQSFLGVLLFGSVMRPAGGVARAAAMLVAYFFLGSPFHGVLLMRNLWVGLAGRDDLIFTSGLFDAAFDQFGLVAGSSDAAVHAVIGLLLALVHRACVDPARGAGPMALASMTLAGLQGSSSLLGATFGLLFGLLLVYLAARQRTGRWLWVLGSFVSLNVLVRVAIGFGDDSKGTHLGQPMVMLEHVGDLLGIVSLGMGARVLWVRHLLLDRERLRSLHAGHAFVTLLLLGWSAGFVSVDLEINDFHFLFLITSVLSLGAGVALGDLWPGLWARAPRAPSPAARGLVLGVVAVFTLGFAGIALRQAPLQFRFGRFPPAQDVGWLYDAFCVAWLPALLLYAATLWAQAPRLAGLRRACLAWLAVPCVLAGPLLSHALGTSRLDERWMRDYVAYHLDADTVRIGRWLRAHTAPSERFLSMEPSLKRTYAVQAIAERAAMGGSTLWRGAAAIEELTQTRQALATLGTRQPDGAAVLLAAGIASSNSSQPTRYLLVHDPVLAHNALVALPEARIAYRSGRWSIVALVGPAISTH